MSRNLVARHVGCGHEASVSLLRSEEGVRPRRGQESPCGCETGGRSAAAPPPAKRVGTETGPYRVAGDVAEDFKEMLIAPEQLGVVRPLEHVTDAVVTEVETPRVPPIQ